MASRRRRTRCPRHAPAGSPAGLQPYDLAFVGGGGATTGEYYGYATVKTDREDYWPGEPVTVTGSGWQPGETVTLTISEDADTHFDFTYNAVAGVDGKIDERGVRADRERGLPSLRQELLRRGARRGIGGAEHVHGRDGEDRRSCRSPILRRPPATCSRSTNHLTAACTGTYRRGNQHGIDRRQRRQDGLQLSGGAGQSSTGDSAVVRRPGRCVFRLVQHEWIRNFRAVRLPDLALPAGHRPSRRSFGGASKIAFTNTAINRPHRNL